jgi:hypothetical protein
VTAAKAVLVASTRALTDVLDVAAVYVRPDGVKVGTGAEIVQAMIDNVPPATIEGAVTQDGDGNYVDASVARHVWTGLPYLGGATTETCRNWTSALPTDTGSGACVATGWQSAGTCGSFACDNSWHDTFLQCAEQ